MFDDLSFAKNRSYVRVDFIFKVCFVIVLRKSDRNTMNSSDVILEIFQIDLLKTMFVEANIIVDSKKGLAIPKDALLNEENKKFVLLLSENKKDSYAFKKVAVTVGAMSEDYVEIIPDSQINKNSKILIKGTYDVAN